MTWLKLDDGFSQHPKLCAIGDLTPLAGWLHVCGLCYCGRYLTDGFIPKRVALSLTSFDGLTVEDDHGGHDVLTKEVVNVIVASGLWERVDGGYQIHDYLDYNPSREKVLAERDAWRDRQQRSRRDSNRDTNSESRRDYHRDSSSPVPVPVPVLESPTPSSKDKTLSARKPVDNSVPESVMGYWLGKSGRDAKPEDVRSLASIVKAHGAEATTYAIGQACVQGEAPDNYALITTICKEA